MDLITKIENQELAKPNFPDFRIGDTIRVNAKVREGNKERIQAFQGICIARKNNGISSSFRVRKISNGVGVERVFPVYSPNVESVEIIQAGSVRRAKLYYLRDRVGKKATKIKVRARKEVKA